MTGANPTTWFRFCFAYFGEIFTPAALVLFTLFCCGGALAQKTAQEKQLFNELNQARDQHGLQPLQWDEQLAHAARQHSQLMASRNKLAHVLPGEESVADRLAATGIRFNRSGENVGYDSNFDDITNAWMNSPPHRENMLSPNYNAVGIGIAHTGDLFYATQDFAHTVEKLSGPQAESQVAQAINRLRQDAGQAPLKVVNETGVRDLACKMAQAGKLMPHQASRLPGVVAAVTYNNSRPTALPDSLQSYAKEPKFSKFAVGACFTKDDKRNPGGTFFVVVAFYR